VEAPPADLDRPAVAYLAGRLYAGAAGERLAAAAALAAMPAALAVPALSGAAADPDPALRAAAVAALSALGTPGAMDLLAGRLAHPDPGVRGTAARALASAGPTAVPALVAALSSPGREARSAAAAVLVRGAYAPTGAPEGAALAIALEDWRGAARFGGDAVEPLGAPLGHPDPDLRLGAVAALGEIGGARAAALLGTAGADPSRAVRDRVALQLQLLENAGG
jgi:HEAT repeat protein